MIRSIGSSLLSPYDPSLRSRRLESPQTETQKKENINPTATSLNEAEKTQQEPKLFGDFDGDGTVDGTDLGALLANFGAKDRKTDLNQDGVVNSKDLNLLLAAWERYSNLQE